MAELLVIKKVTVFMLCLSVCLFEFSSLQPLHSLPKYLSM